MPRDGLVVENGAVAQALLNSNRDENVLYDTIVIGSGIGGGVCASALADEKKQVLVLEAGSLLFPTHVGNLPRRLRVGKFQKHIWDLYYRFNVKNYNNLNGSQYNGAQGFNLGGRSIFWGSSIPPLADWELAVWPKEIRDYLLDSSERGGYSLARGVFNADVPELRPFHKKAVKVLRGALGYAWEVEPAPVAVEYVGATEWSIPAGIFSTADLLLEDAMAEELQDTPGFRYPLTVNCNHAVHSVVFDPNNPKRATGVRCYDLLERRERTYRAKSVIISAGTLESAKIALASKIPNPLIGRGIVDHPIWWRHFSIPPDALERLGMKDAQTASTIPPRLEPQSTKLIIRHITASADKHAFDIIMEIGAQWNQGRYVDPDHIQDELRNSKGALTCEIVFQFYSDLMEDNYVELGSADPATPVNVRMERATLPKAVLDEARQIANTILRKFEATALPDEPDLFANDQLPQLFEADVGGVAHEVGTLRMPVNGKPGVVDQNMKFEGYENLFACDNSVFPCSPAGNPSLTLVALARKCVKAVAKIV